MRDEGEQPNDNPNYNGNNSRRGNKAKGTFYQGSKPTANPHICNKCPHLPTHAVNDCQNVSQHEGVKRVLQDLSQYWRRDFQPDVNPNQRQITDQQDSY